MTELAPALSMAFGPSGEAVRRRMEEVIAGRVEQPLRMIEEIIDGHTRLSPDGPSDVEMMAAICLSDELMRMAEVLNGDCAGFSVPGQALKIIRDEELFRHPRSNGQRKTRYLTRREHTRAEQIHQITKRALLEAILSKSGLGRKRKRREVVASPPTLDQLLSPAQTDLDGFIYFIQAGPDGPIKIGWSREVKKRAATIQSWEPVELECLATLQGPMATEQALHRRFGSARIRGEWFNPTHELLAYIDSVKEL